MLFSRIKFPLDFFTERAPQENVGNTSLEKHIDRLIVTAPRSGGVLYFHWKYDRTSNRCRFSADSYFYAISSLYAFD
jgi:hypothetical protein